MEKIKKIVSHTPRKSVDRPSQGEPASPTTPNKAQEPSSANSADYHPIYDQFTGQSPTAKSPGEPTKTIDHTQQFSNTADLNLSPPNSATSPVPSSTRAVYAQSSPATSLRPDTLSSQPGFTDAMSTASIKSGVLGFPQGGEQHAALQRSPTARRLGNTQTQETSSSLLARDDAALGTGAAQVAGHELRRSHDYDNLRATQDPASTATGSATQESSGYGVAQTSREVSEQPFEQSFDESSVTKDTDRSFPLSGGVAGVNTPTTSNHQPYGASTEEQKLVSKNADAGAVEGDSREALAGAAAAASGVGIVSHLSKSSQEPPKRTQETPSELGKSAQDSESHDREALGGAVAVGVASSGALQSEPSREQPEQEPISTGDPCPPNQNASGGVFTSEPHASDTTNRPDPHLHIPGEFPETPMETPGDRNQGRTGYLSESSYPAASRSTDTSTANYTPQQSREQHHYGRDGVLAASAGAAALGTYEAKKHDKIEPSSPPDEPVEVFSSPYSSQKLDPRLDATSATFGDQRFDPQAQTKSSPQKSNHAIISGMTNPTSQPESSQPTSQSQNEPLREENHYGRGAAVAGAGAATIGALVYEDQRDSDKPETPGLQNSNDHSASQIPTSQTVGPNKSDGVNVVDFDEQKSYGKDQSHLERDIAIAGGAGAAEYGIYETADAYNQHRSTLPVASMDEQRYDPTAPGAHAPIQPSQIHSQGYNIDPSEESQIRHHYGRDAAIVGGLGAAGAGTYAATRGDDKAHQPQPYSENQQPQSHRRYDSVQNPDQQRQAEDGSQHQGRNMAAAGTAAGVTGAGAAYAYSKHDTEKERIAQQKEIEAQLKAQQKEFEAKQKQQQKDFDHQQKELEKQRAKDEKHHNKLVAAEGRAHQKEREKEQSKQLQDVEKNEENEEKKHHGLLGFLHRDKKDKDKSSPETSPRHSKEYAPAYETHEKRNKLHKDPPKGHPARVALENSSPDSVSGRHEHMGSNSPIRRSNDLLGDNPRSGNYDAYPINNQQHY